MVFSNLNPFSFPPFSKVIFGYIYTSKTVFRRIPPFLQIYPLRGFKKSSILKKPLGTSIFSSLKGKIGFTNGIQPDGKNSFVEANTILNLSKIYKNPDSLTPEDISSLALVGQSEHPIRGITLHLFKTIGPEKFKNIILNTASDSFKITQLEFQTFAKKDSTGVTAREKEINSLDTPEIIRTLSDDEKNLILETDSLLTSFKELLLVKTILLKNPEISSELLRPEEPLKGDVFLSKNGEKILTEVKWIGFNASSIGQTMKKNFFDTEASFRNFSGKKALLTFSGEKKIDSSSFLVDQKRSQEFQIETLRVDSKDLLSFASSSPFSFSKEDLNLINNPKYLFFPHSNLIDDLSSKNFSRPFFSTLSNRDFDGVLKEISSSPSEDLPSDF